jgi:hypothetical protein
MLFPTLFQGVEKMKSFMLCIGILVFTALVLSPAMAQGDLPKKQDMSFEGFALQAGPIAAWYFIPDVEFEWEIDGGEDIRRNLQDAIDDQTQYGINLDLLYFGKRYMVGGVGFQYYFPNGDPSSKSFRYDYNLTGSDELGQEFEYRIEYAHRFNFNLYFGGFYPMGRVEIHGGIQGLMDYALVGIHWMGAKPIGYDSEDEIQGRFLFAVAPLIGGGVFVAPHWYLGADFIYAVGIYQSIGGRIHAGYRF